MKLSISNLVWNAEDNQKVYEYLCKKQFSGIEIAPTKFFPTDPYSHIEDAVEYFGRLKAQYGLEVSSMQSIWYGRVGNIFNSLEERLDLQSYTLSAVDFASAIGCKNLVFGNPKARNKPGANDDSEVYDFFKVISDYAFKHNTFVSLEPNPPIYNTNFINTTQQAFEFCKNSGCEHLRVNVDLGTVIYNNESLKCIEDNINLVNHIHISEPYLKKLEKRELHKKLKNLDYGKYFSIEMGLQESVADAFEVIDYIAEVLI